MTKRLQDNPDHWSEIAGMPDEWDRQNLAALINKFKKRKFKVEGFIINGATLIKMCRDEARKSHQLDGVADVRNPYNFKVKDTEMRAVSSLPQALDKEIQLAYPTLFRNKKHFSWFIKKFPEFKISDKY